MVTEGGVLLRQTHPNASRDDEDEQRSIPRGRVDAGGYRVSISSGARFKSEKKLDFVRNTNRDDVMRFQETEVDRHAGRSSADARSLISA